MIERKIVEDHFLEYKVTDFIKETLGDVPIREIFVEKNPMGERITIFTSAPGLVIGREGANIKKLTITLREKFAFENPQIKIGEVEEMFLSSNIMAKRIANDLANFGSQKFKLTAFRAITSIMQAGAMGVEIRISGKLPSARAKSWLFSKGYIKKTGYVSDFLVDKAQEKVTLKTGVVGIKVDIMLPDTPLPDKVRYIENVVPAEIVKKLEDEKKGQEVREVKETPVSEEKPHVAKEEKKEAKEVKSEKPEEKKQKVDKEKKPKKEVKEEK